MNFLQSLLLGVVQGIGEFLPISSSGHLTVVQKLFGLNDVPVLYNVFLHLATLCAVVTFFRKRIWELLCAFVRLLARKPAPLTVSNEDGTKTTLGTDEALAREKNLRQYILAVIIATFITGVIGIGIEKCIGDLPAAFTYAGFIFTGIILLASGLFARKAESAKPAAEASGAKIGMQTAPNVKQALIIGLAQGIGTLPGVSRSGSTISSSLFCRVSREMAGEFSFIVSIPAVFGAFLLELKDLAAMSSIGAAPLAAGFIAAFAVGYAALALLMKIIRSGKLGWFACYLIPAGILGLIFLA